MQVYLILREEEAPAAESLFLRDGFRWSVFLFAPLWLLRHGLWLPLLAYGFAATGIALLGLVPVGTAFLILALHAFIGVEGQHMRVSDLLKKGWRLEGIVSADALDDAEVRYFTDMEGAAARAAQAMAAATGPWGIRSRETQR